MKEKTKSVKSWHELINFVENMNPYKTTIVLTGFINRLEDNKVKITDLVFTTKDIDILRKNDPKNKTKRLANSKKGK